jgi:branched-chain amino acid transport system substrate-binding protein
MKGRTLIAATALAALGVAGCGSSSSSSSSSSSAGSSSTAAAAPGGKCATSVGFEGPITGPVAMLGSEQQHFAQLAVSMDNAANGTNITIVPLDTQLTPSQATTVTQQATANNAIVAIVGPAGSQEVEAVGPLMARAGLAFISGSATNATLTSGKYPTFFRVVGGDTDQGTSDANYIIQNLKPKKVMLIDDQEAYSTGLAGTMIPLLTKAGIKVDHESVSQKVTDFSSLVTKVDSATGVVVLPWQVAANAQQFGKNLAEQHKKAVIFGTDGLYSPSAFKIPGSFVSSFGPDITSIPADASIVQAANSKYGAGSYGTFGPPIFAAQHVIDEAISSVCKSGGTPSRSNVLAAIKATNEPTSILGQAISFASNGGLNNAKFFINKIDPAGKYKLVS